VSAGPAKARVLHVLTGCTAVGKTEWALRWAEANSAEILSCDSLLFYRGMDIGTAKPSAGDLARVRHHLVDIREVWEPMNAALYSSMALASAAEIAARGKAILVVGGSGFYLKSFFGPIADGVEITDETRTHVTSILEARGLTGLVAELALLNPGGLGDLDTDNPRRVASALGRCIASGRSLTELAADFEKLPSPFAGWEIRLARLDRGQPELDARITARAEAMLEAGLVEEVRRLAGALARNPSAARAIGYRETLDVLEGRSPMEFLAASIAKDTRSLVKKQRTWFRTQLPAHRVVEASGLTDPRDLFLG
jgi:tRNA dimethylallyltransferase